MNYNYFIPLIAFSGLIFGLLLSKIAREEIRPGLHYFKLFGKVILGLIIVNLLFNVDRSLISLLLLFVGIVFGYMSSIYSRDYVYLGLCSTISFFFARNIFFLINVFIFLYGLPKGTLFRRFNFKELYKNFILFIIPFLVLVLFLSSLIENVYLVNFLIGVCSGGLFQFFVKRNFINL